MVENKAVAAGLVVYMVGALMATGAGVTDVGAVLVGVGAVIAAIWAHDLAQYRSAWAQWCTTVVLLASFVAWLALPWLLWGAR